jgi:hypothetical protein
MANYLQTNILDMLEYIGEDTCQSILSSFVCPLNPDVEQFIQTKAVEFAKQKIAITYLVFVEHSGQQILVGYYTLANKFVCVNSSSLSKTMQKKIGKFSQYDPKNNRFMVSMPLIAQLGKNYNKVLSATMQGSELLALALDRVTEIEHLIGGKTTYIECNNEPKLYDFYSSSGFIPFDERTLSNETSNSNEEILVQMLKYFNH